MWLTGKRALVTGARGIGAACARALAQAGAHVTVVGRSAGEVTDLAHELGGTGLTVDLSDRRAVDAWLGSKPAVDILVNNAGVAASATLADTTDAMWDRTLEINATAPFRVSRALAPAMMAAKWGRIINIASNAGLTGYAYTSAYVASKHALVGLTRALAVEVARHGVTVNAVCPGFVDTDMASAATQTIAGKTGRPLSEARAALEAMSPQRRLMTADEVAAAVVFLCTDGARGINGQTITIDGGQVLK